MFVKPSQPITFFPRPQTFFEFYIFVNTFPKPNCSKVGVWVLKQFQCKISLLFSRNYHVLLFMPDDHHYKDHNARSYSGENYVLKTLKCNLSRVSGGNYVAICIMGYICSVMFIISSILLVQASSKVIKCIFRE